MLIGQLYKKISLKITYCNIYYIVYKTIMVNQQIKNLQTSNIRKQLLQQYLLEFDTGHCYLSLSRQVADLGVCSHVASILHPDCVTIL